jgi:molybdopterin-containing oxidoreductase family membrane subunit
MLITLLVPLRELYKLEDIVSVRHIDLCCRFVLFMALLITYIYGMEFFIAYYGGNPIERFTFTNRVLGPYGGTWLVMIIFNSVVPQVFWFKSVRTNPWLAFSIVILPSIGMWLERFIIIVSSVHRDFLPSSWGMFYPTWVDCLTYAGTFGVFFLLYLLFIRFLPVIAISEIKAAMPEADPHYHPETTTPPSGGSHA